MDGEDLTAKYHKLALEYSKIRSCTSVLKKAVIEEQKKTAKLREIIQTKEQTQRRIEQELDSVTFCNKQMSKRCEKMMQELHENEILKSVKIFKTKGFAESSVELIEEELQKAITENVRLASLISDKNSEIDSYVSRVAELEEKLAKSVAENIENERKFRKEIDQLIVKYDTESKTGETTNSICSEEALSVSGAIDTPTNFTNEERVFLPNLENEVKKEIFKMFLSNNVEQSNIALKMQKETLNLNSADTAGSQKNELYETIRRRIEDLLNQKILAESKLSDIILECDSFRNHMEIMEADTQEKEQTILDLQSLLQQIEGDLITTRINYEDQISVLTEQVISISDQLAASR